MSNTLTFFEHVKELRNKLGISSIVFVVASVFGYIIFPSVISYFNNFLDVGLHVTKLYEGFFMRVQVSLYIGLIFFIPVFLLNLLLFIVPGFEKGDKAVFVSLFLLSIILYVVAILSVSIFLPITINFLQSKSFIPDTLNKIFSYGEFIDFFFTFLLAFCVSLQFPVVLLVLLYFKILKTAWLTKFIPYFVPVALLLSAIMTQDILSQFLVAVPLFVLYLLCILAAKKLKWGVDDIS
ncbi:MAG: twin-arginine translocase subunit TatC [Spirochaetaceae bacterium]